MANWKGLKRRRVADLPTSKTCKSGDFEKKPRKTWRLRPQTWRFPKDVSNENKNGRFVVSRYSLPYSCYLLDSFAAFFEDSVSISPSTRGAIWTVHSSSFPRDLSTPLFHGNEVGIVPRFPSNFRCDKIGHFQHGFFNIASYNLNCLAISRFSDSLWDLEAKSWDRELIPQTVSLTVKPWELAGLRVANAASERKLQTWVNLFIWRTNYNG